MVAEQDEMGMRRALDLAAQGDGFTQPNPLVGAVIVHQGRILGEGYHHRAGTPHAEIMALHSLRPEDRSVLGESTMYVTLEPCSHVGRTGACSVALIHSGIGRVVAAHQDPNPLVSGRGLAMLREAGVAVEVGRMEREAAELNRRFFMAMQNVRPYITLKWAEDVHGSVDGPRTDSHPGPWAVTGAESQIWTHRMRQRCGALLIGWTTWKLDRTQGNVRAVAGPEIVRILWASRPLSASERAEAQVQGWTVWSAEPGEVPAEALKRHLAQCGLTGILVEGGPRTTQLFRDHHLWDEAYRWVATTTLPEGGPGAPQLDAEWVIQGQTGRDTLFRSLRRNFKK